MGQQGSRGNNSFKTDPNAPTMKAWVATASSPNTNQLSNVSLLTNVPIMEPTRSQVRVKIHAASLNRVDIGRATSAACTYPAILGTDGAGVVEKVGDEEIANGQYKIFVGDKVYFHLETVGTAGTFAEYCVVELSCIAKLDPNASPAAALEGANPSNASGVSNPTAPEAAPHTILSFAEAATMPSAAWTAFIALFDKLKIEKGRVIFIDGAAGGVGSYAVQMCKMMGLFVIGTCSTYNVEYLTSLGVDVVVDYVMDDIPDKLREWTQSRGVDYFLELVSPEQGERYAKHIRFGGSLCLVGGAIKNLTQDLLFLNQISVHHVNLNGMHRDPLTWPLLAYLGNQCVQMASNKSLVPCYHEVIPFEQAKDALIQLALGHAKGKIVLRIVGPPAKARRNSKLIPPPPIEKPASPPTDGGEEDVKVVTK